MQSPTTTGRRPLPPRPSRPLPPRPSGPNVAALPATAHPTLKRSRPDPTGLRVAIGFGGLAAASALATAFLAPATAATVGGSTTAATTTLVGADLAPVQRVIRYVHLLPGQTPPPNASVVQAPVATPRVVVVTTRQSGAKP